jgi:hypothetical protein
MTIRAGSYSSYSMFFRLQAPGHSEDGRCGLVVRSDPGWVDFWNGRDVEFATNRRLSEQADGVTRVHISSGPDSLLRLTPLEIMAVVGQPGYVELPEDKRLCMLDDCPNWLKPGWTAVYCSNECAWRDA